VARADVVVTCTLRDDRVIDAALITRGRAEVGVDPFAIAGATAVAPTRICPADDGPQAPPQLIIDLGLPRNVAPDVTTVAGVELLDLQTISIHAQLDGLNATTEARCPRPAQRMPTAPASSRPNPHPPTPPRTAEPAPEHPAVGTVKGWPASIFGAQARPFGLINATFSVFLSSSLGVSMSVTFAEWRGSVPRIVALAAAGVLVASSLALGAAPAHAVLPSYDFNDANGIEYAYNDGAAGATVTAVSYDSSYGAEVVIPAEISNGADGPYQVTSIGATAFMSTALTSVTFAAGLSDIGQSAFYGNSLGSVVIPETVTTIGDYAFSTAAVTSLTLRDGLVTIGAHAFEQNALLTEVDVPASVTSIGDYAFYRTSLADVTLHNGLTEIGAYAFAYTALASVHLPASVITIGPAAFFSNPSVLTSVTFAGPAPAVIEDYTLGNAEDVTVHYLSQFGTAAGAENGFMPTPWNGYTTVIDPIVSFNTGGHGTVEPQRLIAASLAEAPAPTESGWALDGWFTDADLTAAFDFTAAPTDDMTLQAKWTAVDPSVTVASGLREGESAEGKTVTATGANGKPDAATDVIVRSTPTTIASGVVNPNGTFALTGVIPSGLEAGPHTVTLSTTAANGTPVTSVVYFTLNSAGIVTYLSYTEAQSLASTGFDPAPLGSAALLLLLAGAALVLRRRRSIA